MYKVKNVSIIVTIICLLTTMACTKGKGDIVSNVIELDEITGVGLAIEANVVITKGDIQDITIEAQQNVIDNIKRTVENGVWNIEFDKEMRKYDDVTIYITASSISKVAISVSGKITSESTFITDNLDVSISGSGDIDFSTETTTIDASISGSSNIDISGTTDSQVIRISGDGDYKGFNLESNNTETFISGSGNCEVYVNTRIDANISGSGSVYYKGTPSTINHSITGSGELVDAN